MNPIQGICVPTLEERARRGSELRELLTVLRRRVDPHTCVLGLHARLSRRVGKRVTQEELAETIGISREWYVKLERGTARTVPSTRLLQRLADALMATPEERRRLFALALPEVDRLPVCDDSIAVLEAFSRLRRLAKPLWAATSIDDVLMIAREQIADWFDGAALVRSVRRYESGLWDTRSVDDKQDRSKLARVFADIEDSTLRATGSLDASNLSSQVVHVGDVGTPDLWPLRVQRAAHQACARHRVVGIAGMYARVRSHDGFTGALYIGDEMGHRSYPASDRAIVGAFAELTSFALS
jgi:transcriptional regulator with XRE-family HTH domain